METVFGTFSSRTDAEAVVRELLNSGIPQDEIIYVTPGTAAASDVQSEGVGSTLAAYSGGVVAGGAGLTLGTAAASMLVPGLGPIIAIGLGAAALLGIGGAVAGHAVGQAGEKALEEEHERKTNPKLQDESSPRIHAALRQKRSVVAVRAESAQTLHTATEVLRKSGSPLESVA
jgi:hypothetical protein